MADERVVDRPASRATLGVNVSRRALIRFTGGVLAGAGASSVLAGNPAGAAKQASGSTWQGTITMFAQAYTPNSKLKNAIQLKAFQEVADEYQKAHRGITIKFIDEDLPEYLQTVRVKAAGRELWDIFWAQWGDLNGTLPQGIARDLAPEFKQPNPYIQSNTAWQDAMNQTVINETIAPNGAHYSVNGDYVGTAFFYNKTLFEKAGITTAPASWNDLLAANKKLTDAKITAAVGIPDYSWFQRHFLTDFYSQDYEKMAGCDKSPAMSPLDEAAAIKQGPLNTGDPRFMAWWPLFKRVADSWNQDYLSQPLSATGDKMMDDFVAGKGAMFYNGSWLPNQLKVRKVDFELGAFSFPVLDKDVTEYTTGINTAGAVGGPNAAYQYAMSTSKSNKTLEDADKEAAVLDWLRYIGTPQVIEKVVNELGSFAPTWPHTKPVAGLESFAEQANTELKVVWVGNSSPKLLDNMQRAFGLFLSGNSDIKAATTQVKKELDTAVADYGRTNKVDLSQCR